MLKYVLLPGLLLLAATVSAETVFTMSRTASGDGTYTPGGTLDLTVTLQLTTDGTVTAFGHEDTIPDGWTYVGLVSAGGPNIEPFPGKTGLLEFGWFPVPSTFPVSFTYRVAIAEEASGPASIVGNGVLRILGQGAVVTPTVTTTLSDPKVAVPDVRGLSQQEATDALIGAGFAVGDISAEYSVGYPVDQVKKTDPATGALVSAGAVIDLFISLGPGQTHTGDTLLNGVISLSELLRVVQFFNLNGYRCSATPSEDGYVAGTTGAQDCGLHDSDTNDDWDISLSELLRFVQFFNLGGYHYCPDASPATEDGFCPGP
ncbi:MAG: PASTA domain-containing protein [Candidatus Hydrogenedentes bacterium]|nr:PASTA domain-containing protein [Candidatus Hydrogenedentota bacterium]